MVDLQLGSVGDGGLVGDGLAGPRVDERPGRDHALAGLVRDVSQVALLDVVGRAAAVVPQRRVLIVGPRRAEQVGAVPLVPGLRGEALAAPLLREGRGSQLLGREELGRSGRAAPLLREGARIATIERRASVARAVRQRPSSGRGEDRNPDAIFSSLLA